MPTTSVNRTASLLTAIRENAAAPIEKMTPAPPAAYHDETLLGLEREHIFEQEWSCVGRQSEIPNPGDYLTFEIAGRPAFAIRDDAGRVRSFSNACLHRMTRLMEGRGQCNRIVCPYHAWSYERDGRLRNAPLTNGLPEFSVEGQSLPELPTEIWEGFIYISLDTAAEPIGPRLAGLSQIVDGYGIADFVDIRSFDQVWDTNWKILCENFIESYHVFKVHADTFEKSTPTSSTKVHDGTEDWAVHFQYARTEAATRLAPEENTELEGDRRRQIVIANVFPSHLISITPRSFWHLSLQPLSPGRVHVRAGFAASPYAITDEGPEAFWNEFMGPLYDKALAEDRSICESVFVGTRAKGIQPGPLLPLERGIADFGRYLARRLAAADEPAG